MKKTKRQKVETPDGSLARACDFRPNVRNVSVFYFFVKRFFDVIISFLGITVLLPFFLIIAIPAAISSKGKPFFADRRVGKDGKTIWVLKFRSMYADAETNAKKYLNEEQMKQWLEHRKVDNDPRVTKFGIFLRATSIDELPQLFNIFAGQLSIVGPRPVTQREIDGSFFPDQAAILLSIRPGLIGNWGVHGRSNVTYASGKRQRLELEYFERRSVWFDLALMFKAVPAVLHHDGAR